MSPQRIPNGAGVPVGSLVMVVVWVMVACVLATVNADPDLWGHLRFGLDMLRERTLPSVDPYSFTQDIPWVNHEWLAELQMGIAYTLGGVPGLWVLRTVLFALVSALLAWQTRPIPLLPRIAVVLVTMWAAAPIAASLRPQIWSYALLAITSVLLSAQAPSRRLLWVPVVLLLWVNVHGGWIVGGLLVAIWALARVREERWRGWAITIGVLCVAATMVNPYGPGIWQFLLRTVRIGRDAQEWQPLTRAPLRDWWPWVVTLATPIVLVVTRHRIDAYRLVTIVTLSYLSFRVVRLIPMFTLVTAIYVVPTLCAAVRRVAWLEWQPLAPSRSATALFLVPLSGIAWAAFPVNAAGCLPVRGSWIPEPLTARALQRAQPTGKLVTEFGWGEYAIWHFGPRLQVSMDGRRETVYSDATLLRYDRMMDGDPEALQLLIRERPEYVWAMSRRTALKRWVFAHGYRVDLDNDSAWLAVRSDLPIVDAVSVASRQCFPA